MENQKTQLIKLKAYTLQELAFLYEVDKRTFKNWLLPFEAGLGPKIGRYYNINQVRYVFEKLGYPIEIAV